MQYVLREHPRARRINVTVRRDGTVWVTKPRRVSVREVERFVEKCGEWIERAQKKFAKLPKTSKIESAKKEYLKYKEQVRDEVARRISHFNSLYRTEFSNISIRNQRTRWGSCSRTGTLSFNYRIVFLQEHLVDYIVVHELCHMREMNHSRRFWALVAQTIPNHVECRRELRKLERGLLQDS